MNHASHRNRIRPPLFDKGLTIVGLATASVRQSVAARRLVTSPELRGQMGAAAHAHAMETALWSAKLERMNEIFAELINRDRKFR